jgi:hypothetical protein
VFYFTLSNQGGTPVSDITIKVECAVEGGSKGVLYDNSTSPLPRLPASGRHDVIVTTDIKEQGQVELVASAVFTGVLSSLCCQLFLCGYRGTWNRTGWLLATRN